MKHKYQINLPMESSKLVIGRKLRNRRVHNIYLLQYNTPPKITLYSHMLPLNIRECPPPQAVKKMMAF